MYLDQLQNILDQLSSLWFEISLILGAMVVLTTGLFSSKNILPKLAYVLTLLIALYGLSPGREESLLLSDFVKFDGLTEVVKLLFVILSLWVVFFGGVKSRKSEFYFLLLSVIAGSAFMASANHLLFIYLAIELTSLASYLITNFNFEKRSYEAGLKYLLFGGVSSAIALYGISLVYGYTGTMVLSEMNINFIGNQLLFNFGLIAFIGGLLFKISLVPFHIWTPSVYEETPTEALPVLSTVPKIGALVLLHNLFLAIDLQSIDWMLHFVGFVGVASIAIGTLGAIRQTIAKRLVAYGAIAHSGFLLAALIIPGDSGAQAFIWYAIVYGFMNLAVFYLLDIFEQQGIKTIEDFAGMWKQEGYIGALLVISMIALIGLPPTAGFTAKFYLFSAMWEQYQKVLDPLVLTYLITAVISIIISLYFYLKIPYYYFLKESERQIDVKPQFYERIIATIFTLVLLWLFFAPDLLNKIAESINFIAW